MPEKKEYKLGHCQNEACGAPMKLKPADRKFCKPRCRYAHYNRTRGRVTYDVAEGWIERNMMTVREAAESTRLPIWRIRSMIAAGRLKAKRVFGRVLLYRHQVERESNTLSAGRR